MPPTDPKCPAPDPIDLAKARGGRLLMLLILIPMLLAIWLGWEEADAAVIGTPYWRVTLNQGTGAVGYGQGATHDEAWTDCDRLARLTRALTAAETRLRAVGAVTANTVRWCSGPARYVTVGPDPVATCPAPPASTTRAGTCPTGTTGTWTQTSTSTVGPPPACTVSTTWAPTTPPSGACTPNTTTPPPGGAILNWTHSGTNVTGFMAVYGTRSNFLTNQLDSIPASARQATITGLTPGTTYYFSIIAKGPCRGTPGSPLDPYVCEDSYLSNVVSKVAR